MGMFSGEGLAGQRREIDSLMDGWEAVIGMKYSGGIGLSAWGE